MVFVNGTAILVCMFHVEIQKKKQIFPEIESSNQSIIYFFLAPTFEKQSLYHLFRFYSLYVIDVSVYNKNTLLRCTLYNPSPCIVIYGSSVSHLLKKKYSQNVASKNVAKSNNILIS